MPLAATATTPVALTPGSRRRPYPYDAYIGPVRVLLEPDKDGNIVSSSTKTLDETAPIDYTYSSANPYRERTSEWQKLFGGFGQAVAPDSIPRRYYYSEKADLSIDGLWMKGPAFERHRETIAPPGACGQVRQLLQARFNSQATLFALCERGVWRQTFGTTTWTNTLSFPPGTYGQQAVVFKHRGATSVDALYVTASDGNLYRLQGPSDSDLDWEIAAAGAGPPDYGTGVGQARYIERVGDELWVAGDYGVAKCEDDPFVRANWSGTITVGSTEPHTWVGDQQSKITWLRQIDNTLIIFKEDGLYTIDTEGLDYELFPTLRGKNRLENGRNAAVWLDRIWFSYGDQTFTITGAGGLRPDGLEQMLENTSEVRGQWVGGAGHNTWFFYEVYYNYQEDKSYLIKHGSWIEETEEQATPGTAIFAEAHHGSIYDWDRRATCVYVGAGLDYGATSFGNNRLYVGFLDGTLEWCVLPQHSPNPAADRHTEFTDLDSWVYLPQHHSSFRSDLKLWHAVTVFGPRLDTSNWVEVEYRTDVGNTLAEWIKVSPEEPRFTIPGQRLDLTENEVTHPIYGRAIETRVHLLKETGDVFKNETPIIEGIAIHESIRPAFSREFFFSVRLGSFLPRRDGTVDRRRAFDVQQDVLKVAATIGPINVLLPTGQTEEMTIINYRDNAFARQNVRDHTWTMEVQAIQLRTMTEGAPEINQPLPRGLTYTTLEGYTLGQLESVI